MMTLYREQVDSPLGSLTLMTEKDGTVRLLEFTSESERTSRHTARQAKGAEIVDGPAPGPAREALAAYFAGDMTALDGLTVAADGTPFRKKVWAALRSIPVGKTWSYGELAQAIGSPKGFRAVGSANGANPISIIVPCHRVIAADGSIGGYAGGLNRKEWLLAHEAKHCG